MHIIRTISRPCGAAAVSLGLIAGAASAQNYELVWSDEFEGTALNTDSWDVQIGTGQAYGLPDGWGNQELQYYTNFPENIVVSDGTLKINALENSFGGKDYTSARIRTAGNHDFLYGRFEGRIKLPSTPGIWPAFWMLPTDTPYGIWAASGELDIMESVNIADRIYGTAHFGFPSPGNTASGTSVVTGEDFSDDFHVYAIEWEPDEVRWYLDGQLYYTLTSSTWFSSNASGNNRAPFDVDFHLLLNVAVGGQFPGSPNGSSVFPQTMEIDWVRVFQSVQAPFAGAPMPIPGQIEAEDFDAGNNGQSYNDSDSGNNGGAYRDTDVDIEPTAGGGFNVGWIDGGEWLEYTVDVAQAGTYDLTARVASESTGGSFRIDRDGEALTGNVQVPITGGWQNWSTVSTTIDLEAGEQVLRFFNILPDPFRYNLDWIRFDAQDTACAPADLNGDGSVSFPDVSVFLGAFAAGDLAADFNGDGSVSFPDVSAFLNEFSQGCP